MKQFAALLLALVAGCSEPKPSLTPKEMALLSECFAVAAYECVKAEQAAVLNQPRPCCGVCGKNGLPKGKVLSGDGISVVDCPCDPGCSCKSQASSRPLNICTSGTCKTKK